LSVEAATVRARCDRTGVERCRMTFGEEASFGSVMPILSIDVRWGRVIAWVCKPEVTGSIPVRSIDMKPCKRGAFVVLGGRRKGGVVTRNRGRLPDHPNLQPDRSGPTD
jgi:hypothetical protein